MVLHTYRSVKLQGGEAVNIPESAKEVEVHVRDDGSAIVAFLEKTHPHVP